MTIEEAKTPREGGGGLTKYRKVKWLQDSNDGKARD